LRLALSETGAHFGPSAIGVPDEAEGPEALGAPDRGTRHARLKEDPRVV
jgi:hypothetical protein